MGFLIELPLRVAGEVVRFVPHAVERTAELALDAGAAVVWRILGLDDGDQEPFERSETAARTAPSSNGHDPAPRVDPPSQPPPPPVSPAPPEPEHVSSEPTVAWTAADEGAEDGAGAELNVADPWEGYSTMTAREVIGRIGSADAAELAVVLLREEQGRNRKTVHEAIGRRLAELEASET